MNRVVIITGGSDGIGKSLCLEYGNKGYQVVFTGRDQQKIKATGQYLSERGIENCGYHLDVRSDADNQELVRQTLDSYGRIDVIICNAGLSMRALFKDLSLEVFQSIMQTNFYGAVSLIKFALPHLIHTKGTIIGISSVNGRRATPARTAYAASKYALEGFLESLRMELKMEGVHVLVVCPGFTNTNMRVSAIMTDGTPQGETKLNESRMMSPNRVARKVFRAMEHRKRDLVLTTQGKLAVFANKFFPRLMDRIVFRVMSRKPDSPFYKK